jgi:two-component system sensor histidine kinase DesK
MSTRQRPVWRSPAWPVTGVVLGVLAVTLVAAGARGVLAAVLPALIAAAAVGVATWAVRRNRADRAGYEARLTGWAAAEAVLAERMRIARDLHDIVSHGLGVITVRAAAARLVADAGGADGSAEARDALADIETVGRNATAELRRMLTVLRAADDEAVPRRPAEGLDQLPAIVRDAEITGLRVRLTLEAVGEVSLGAQIAVCKTVREALHNAARHAGPTDVRVHVHRDGDAVVATVSDDGPAGFREPVPGAGHGLIGLHERIRGLGGSLHAEADEPGFRVTARIPDRIAG